MWIWRMPLSHLCHCNYQCKNRMALQLIFTFPMPLPLPSILPIVLSIKVMTKVNTPLWPTAHPLYHNEVWAACSRPAASHCNAIQVIQIYPRIISEVMRKDNFYEELLELQVKDGEFLLIEKYSDKLYVCVVYFWISLFRCCFVYFWFFSNCAFNHLLLCCRWYVLVAADSVVVYIIEPMDAFVCLLCVFCFLSFSYSYSVSVELLYQGELLTHNNSIKCNFHLFITFVKTNQQVLARSILLHRLFLIADTKFQGEQIDLFDIFFCFFAFGLLSLTSL